MASLKTVLYLGVCVSAWITTTAGNSAVPKAENVRWVSLDFKTVLTWTTIPSNHTFTVWYSEGDRDWRESLDCTRVSDSECDLTNHLEPFNRTYTADIKTEPVAIDYDYDLEELPHTYSPSFNPYRESNISAVKFTVEPVDESRVMVNITDPLTSVHKREKQLSIRDVFKNDLKYKISYNKAGSTGKRDVISDSNMAEVSKLDPGQSYCFMVAVLIPSRPKTNQQGAWSVQRCTQSGDSTILQELSVGAWVGVVLLLLAVLIIIVAVLCCRCRRQRNRSLHTSQSSSPI